MTSAPNRTIALEGAAAAVAVAATVVACGIGRPGTAGTVAVLLGTGAATWLGTRERLAVPSRAIWIAAIGLAVVACLRAPFGSHDMWSYAMYGRILEHHNADPYHVLPAHFGGDPVLRMVGVGWRHTPSAYGPLFVVYAAFVSRLGGSNLTALRIGFQVPAAIAALCAGAWAQRVGRRRGVGTRVLAVALLQPFLWCSIVNGAHNDIWVALAAIAAVLLIDRDRAAAAGLILGAAALIKITALLAVPALALALLARRDLRRAIVVSITAGGVAAAGALLAPASLTTAASATRGIVSRASLWRTIVDLTHLAPARATTLGLAVTVVTVLAIAWFGRRTDHAVTVALALAAYGVLGSYVLPWYVVWALPVAAAVAARRVGALVGAHGGLLLAAYEIGRSSDTRQFAGGILVGVVPVATVIAYGIVAVTALRAVDPSSLGA